jgi:hypothetical protein
MAIDFEYWDTVQEFTINQARSFWFDKPEGMIVFQESQEYHLGERIRKEASCVRKPGYRPNQAYSRESLKAFAEKIGMKPAFLFPELRGKPQEEKPAPYKTDLMRLVDKAAAHFWSSYDASKPETEQTGKEEITRWIKTEWEHRTNTKLGDGLANAVEQIICPFARRGGYKKRV